MARNLEPGMPSKKRAGQLIGAARCYLLSRDLDNDKTTARLADELQRQLRNLTQRHAQSFNHDQLDMIAITILHQENEGYAP